MCDTMLSWMVLVIALFVIVSEEHVIALKVPQTIGYERRPYLYSTYMEPVSVYEPTYLSKFGLNDEHVAQIEQQFPGVTMRPTVPEKLSELQSSLGLSKAQVARIILNQPMLLGFSVERYRRTLAIWREHFGFSVSALRKAFLQTPQLAATSHEPLLELWRILVSTYRLSVAKARALVQKQPRLAKREVVLSLELRILFVERMLRINRAQSLSMLQSNPWMFVVDTQYRLPRQLTLLLETLQSMYDTTQSQSQPSSTGRLRGRRSESEIEVEIGLRKMLLLHPHLLSVQPHTAIRYFNEAWHVLGGLPMTKQDTISTTSNHNTDDTHSDDEEPGGGFMYHDVDDNDDDTSTNDYEYDEDMITITDNAEATRSIRNIAIEYARELLLAEDHKSGRHMKTTNSTLLEAELQRVDLLHGLPTQSSTSGDNKQQQLLRSLLWYLLSSDMTLSLRGDAMVKVVTSIPSFLFLTLGNKRSMLSALGMSLGLTGRELTDIIPRCPRLLCLSPQGKVQTMLRLLVQPLGHHRVTAADDVHTVDDGNMSLHPIEEELSAHALRICNILSLDASAYSDRVVQLLREYRSVPWRARLRSTVLRSPSMLAYSMNRVDARYRCLLDMLRRERETEGGEGCQEGEDAWRALEVVDRFVTMSEERLRRGVKRWEEMIYLPKKDRLMNTITSPAHVRRRKQERV